MKMKSIRTNSEVSDEHALRTAMQNDWEKWQPNRIGDAPNMSFATGYKMAVERIEKSLRREE